MSGTRSALVVGGGIAGPAVAMALQKAGIEATVFERHPGGADGVGSFLTLAANGIDALRVLGADKPAIAAGFPTPAIRLRNAKGKYVGDTRTGPELPDGTGSHTMKRADLYAVMHDATVRSAPLKGHHQRVGHQLAVRRYAHGPNRRRVGTTDR